MKRFKIGDVVYIKMQDITAVIKDMDEFVCMIEYMHNYCGIIRQQRTVHAMSWMNARAFKMNI